MCFELRIAALERCWILRFCSVPCRERGTCVAARKGNRSGHVLGSAAASRSVAEYAPNSRASGKKNARSLTWTQGQIGSSAELDASLDKAERGDDVLAVAFNLSLARSEIGFRLHLLADESHLSAFGSSDIEHA